MVLLRVKVNSLFENDQSSFIDSLSKCYIVAESLLGLNRLPFLFKKSKYCYIITSLACVYSFALSCLIIYKTFGLFVVSYMLCFEYVFCVVFSFISCKRIERYYRELNEFDFQIGCRPRTTNESLRNLIFTSVFTGSVGVFYVWYLWPSYTLWLTLLAVFRQLHCVELSYCGHLLSLLAPRLRLINFYMESSLSNGSSAKRPEVVEFKSFENKNRTNSGMIQLMDLYYVTIKSYDSLMDAVKWQLLIILISSFYCTLTFIYVLSFSVMRLPNPLMEILTNLGLMSTEMLPLFSPCVFGDRVQSEVRKLKELLASRLYENKLDKTGRSTARALLALTEARDLSFSLLRMLRVDVALPFKFTGLLVTYLIILLQFDKIINPATTTSP